MAFCLIKSSRPQTEIDAEYALLQRTFNHLANDNNTELKVIAFLSVVFSCQTGLIDKIIDSKSNEIESRN
uniref:Uncharacterized protein n=1 Tax=Panagrolaimus sp. PS1159 TaxID=55785 RepID=A0AC35FL09_9BILA